MCFYVFRTSIPRSRLLLGLSFAILLASTCLFKCLVLTQSIVGSYILFYFAFSTSFSVKDFAKSGDFSYGVYLYAWPIQQLVILYFEKHLDITLMFILSMIFTMMCAYLSWHYIEKPFLSMKSKKKKDEAFKQEKFVIA